MGESSQPLTGKGSAPCGTSQLCVEALLPHSPALLAKGISCLVTPTPWHLHLQLQLQALPENKSHTR